MKKRRRSLPIMGVSAFARFPYRRYEIAKIRTAILN